jgi:hypothetical protein
LFDAPGTRSSDSELYIYYKVAPGQRAAALLAVGDLLRSCRALGVTARLMQRRDVASDGSQTWMEVYGHVPEHFDTTLLQLVRQLGLDALTGERRAEWFAAFDLDA